MNVLIMRCFQISLFMVHESAGGDELAIETEGHQEGRGNGPTLADFALCSTFSGICGVEDADFGDAPFLGGSRQFLHINLPLEFE